MARVGRGVLLLVVLALCGANCSLLVEDEPSQLRCSQEGFLGAPACDPGQVCAAGRCRACITFDVCGDGIDNDCNGRIDDCRSEGSGGEGGGNGGGNGGGTSA